MSFPIPDLQQLIDNAEADLSYESVQLTLRPKIEGWLARMLAGAVRGLYLYMQKMWIQLWPWSATGEYLLSTAEWWGIKPNVANTARGLATVSFTTAAILPRGAILRSDSGVSYSVSEMLAVTQAKSDSVVVFASQAGANGNLLAGTRLNLVLPISGIGAIIVGSDGITQGRDAELESDLRVRLQNRIVNPPSLGTKSDYVTWAKNSAGVSRAWCLPWVSGDDANNFRASGLAEQIVLVICADDSNRQLVASPAALALAKSNIAASCPANIQPRTRSVVPYLVNVRFNSLTPNSPAINAAVTTALSELFINAADLGKIVLASQIRTAIGTVPGLVDYSLAWPTDNNPTSLNPFQIYVFNGITVAA